MHMTQTARMPFDSPVHRRFTMTWLLLAFPVEIPDKNCWILSGTHDSRGTRKSHLDQQYAHLYISVKISTMATPDA